MFKRFSKFIYDNKKPTFEVKNLLIIYHCYIHWDGGKGPVGKGVPSLILIWCLSMY
jgi:hypothetical protein